MKRISKGYYKAASLLTLWAAADIIAYFVETVVLKQTFFLDYLQIVQYYPYLAGAKVVIAALVLAVAAIRGKQKRKIWSITAVTWLVSVAVFLSWSVGMYCATALAAEAKAATYSQSYATRSTKLTNTAKADGDFEIDDFCSNHIVWNAAYISSGNTLSDHPAYCPEGSGFLGHLNCSQVCSVTAVFDNAGNVVTGTWEDVIFLYYQTEEQWKSSETYDPVRLRIAYDRDKLTEDGEYQVFSNPFGSHDLYISRYTGYFEGTEFVLQKVEYIHRLEYENVADLDQGKGNRDFVLIKKYDLSWRLLYENDGVTVPEGESVTLYAYSSDLKICYGKDTPGFTYNGEKYDNLADYVRAVGPQALSGRISGSEFEAGGQFLTSVVYCINHQGERQFSQYGYNTESLGDGTELDYYVVTVVYCRPWIAAMGELIYVYISTFILALGLVLMVRRTVKRHLTMPLMQTCMALCSIDETLYNEFDFSEEWQEGQLLAEGWQKTRYKVLEHNNEIARLNTALDYAKSAEEHRRRMTSNIAHELKTPLAVIHSYAEGLKEHIAEEKRDKYVDVILSEAKRTDAMVLEMLDLSRLEAGKVKLSQDTFSLIGMTRSAFEKLAVLAEEKRLNIQFQFPEEFSVTADEKRMAQVVENFASNAVRYTPEGGNVVVTIQKRRDGAAFIMENDSQPLPPEALERVWDSFYRVEESRSSKGTGLGLAIAKSIVELHGGKCSVRNTPTGVQFSFTI